MGTEKARIMVLGDSIPHAKVRKTFYRFVEIFNGENGYEGEDAQSKNIVGVRFSKGHVSARVLIDGRIRERTYEALANFKGRSSYGVRCFGDVEIVDGYISLGLSSMEYDPDTAKEELKN